MAFVNGLLVVSCRNQVRETFHDAKKQKHLLKFSSLVTLCSSNKECGSVIDILLRSSVREYSSLSQ